MRIASGVTVVALSLLSLSSLYAQSRANTSPGRSQVSAARNSRAQRAISNRQQVLNRVLGRTQGTPRANAAASTRGRFPDVNALRRAALQRVGAQTGTGRVNRELAYDRTRGIGNRTVIRDRNESLRRSGLRRRNGFGSDRSGRPVALSGETDPSSFGRSSNGRRGRNDAVSQGRNRITITQADRLLAKRLASIDRLRDVGLRNGNVKLLEMADRLEQLARQQFVRRTDGEKMDVPAIFRPMSPATRREARETLSDRTGSNNQTATKNNRRK